MGSSSDGDNDITYAEYIEEAHKRLLNHSGTDVNNISIIDSFNHAQSLNPYANATNITTGDAFFTGGYSITDFPSLWDMFGKFMAGLDVHHLFLQTYNGVIDSAEIKEAVTAQAAYLDDDIQANILPKFQSGMRDINAVSSSAFMTGRAIIADARIKAINKFSSELRLRVLDASADMWKKHLDWNQSVISTYSTMFKLYYSVEMDVNAQKVAMQMKRDTFSLSLFEYVRAVLGVVSGSTGTMANEPPSQGASMLSGALGGASVGAALGPWGAAAGGVLGLASSFL